MKFTKLCVFASLEFLLRNLNYELNKLQRSTISCSHVATSIYKTVQKKKRTKIYTL